MTTTISRTENKDTTIPIALSEDSKSDFKGQFGPLEEEISVKRYLEKHKNAPIFKGAFKNVKNDKYIIYVVQG